jgi:hypothetical protein
MPVEAVMAATASTKPAAVRPYRNVDDTAASRTAADPDEGKELMANVMALRGHTHIAPN